MLERLGEFGPDLWRATLETAYMVFASTVFALSGGFVLSVAMILVHPRGLRPKRVVYNALDWLVNLGRSFPFTILMISIQPFTRLVAGTTLGNDAAIVSLSIAAAPLAARLIEGCFLEVDRGVVEAARSFGAGDMQIIWRVLLPEALPAVVLNIAVIAITLLGYAAMAGTVGGGGLGDFAMKYGYYRFQTDLMLYAVVILIIMVQLTQTIGGFIYRRLR
ncbi:MAG: ABC transporter permease [Planctomycetota bacterium]|nr:ABC transporter permease [Planctomycetota bacterium]